MSDLVSLSEKTGMSRFRSAEDAIEEARERNAKGRITGILIIYVDQENDDGNTTMGYMAARMDNLERLGALRHVEHMIHEDLKNGIVPGDDP